MDSVMDSVGGVGGVGGEYIVVPIIMYVVSQLSQLYCIYSCCEIKTLIGLIEPLFLIPSPSPPASYVGL